MENKPKQIKIKFTYLVLFILLTVTAIVGLVLYKLF